MSTETDPRFLKSRETILNAARQLLMRHGPAAVTHAKVAEYAAIGRATVYRHWPRTDQLLAEAMATVSMPFFSKPTRPTREWLRGELTGITRELELDDVRAVTTTLANSALWDPDMDTRREQFAHVLAERLAHALDNASTAGEVRLRADPRAAAALAIGPVYYRSIIEHGTADSDFIEAVIDALGTWARR